jgi:hypothetical protein
MRQRDPPPGVRRRAVRIQQVRGRRRGVTDEYPALRGYPAIVVGQLAYSIDINGLLIQDAKEDGFSMFVSPR